MAVQPNQRGELQVCKRELHLTAKTPRFGFLCQRSAGHTGTKVQERTLQKQIRVNIRKMLRLAKCDFKRFAEIIRKKRNDAAAGKIGPVDREVLQYLTQGKH